MFNSFLIVMIKKWLHMTWDFFRPSKFWETILHFISFLAHKTLDLIATT